jgi:hypothetical protein
MSLVWDFYRALGTVDSSGSVVHYYETSSQSIYLSGGLATQVGKVPEGHWRESDLGEMIYITDDSFSLLTADHPANGILHMAATDGTKLYFLRYVYAMDISAMCESGTWKAQNDNAITQMSISVKNVGAATFASEATLFNPGAKLTLALQMGNSEPYPLAVAFLDEVDYEQTADTVPISGRNVTGYKLASQTFDLNNSFTGYSHEIAAAILDLAGVEDYEIQPGLGAKPFIFSYDTKILDGLKEMFAYYTVWRMAELPDGKIVIGYEDFVTNRVANSYYEFNGEKEVFKRKTKKAADAAYTHVLVTGDDGIDPVYLEVSHFPFWALGGHKTAHIKAPSGLTAAQLAEYATAVASELQYVGMSESFSSPIRPQLLVGDVASVYYTGDTESTSLGVITDITHSFGETGFFTDFTVDSGGVVTDGENYTVISRSAVLAGYNRKQRFADLIKVVADKSIWSR